MKRSFVLLFLFASLACFATDFIVLNGPGPKVLRSLEIDPKGRVQKERYIFLIGDAAPGTLNVYSETEAFFDDSMKITEFTCKTNAGNGIERTEFEKDGKECLIRRQINDTVLPVQRTPYYAIDSAALVAHKVKNGEDFTFRPPDILGRTENTENVWTYKYYGESSVKTEAGTVVCRVYEIKTSKVSGKAFYTEEGTEICSEVGGSESYNLGYFPSKRPQTAFFVEREISPYLFGNNYWNENYDMMAAAGFCRYVNIGMIRWGGIYRDKKAADSRALSGFAEFAGFTGAVPLVQLSYISGDDVPGQAEKLMEYLPKLRYVSLSNEINISQTVYGKSISLALFDSGYRSDISKLRERFPDLSVVGPDFSVGSLPQYDPWLNGFLDENGGLIDVLSVHRYPMNGEQPAETTLRDIDAFSEYVDGLADLLKRKKMDLPVAITETNTSWNYKSNGSGNASVFVAALWTAANYVTAIEKGLWSLQLWSLLNDGTLSLVNDSRGLTRYGPEAYAYLAFRDFSKKYIVTENDVPGLKIALSYSPLLRSVVGVAVNYSPERIGINLKNADGTVKISRGNKISFAPYSLNTVYLGGDLETVKLVEVTAENFF